MPIPLSHIIAFACFSYITDLLVWLIPFIFNPSDYVPQIDSPVPDQLNNGLMTYVPHPLITLPMLPQLTTPAPSGYFDIQPTSPIPLGYFGPMMELSTTLEPPCGPTAYLDRVYTAIKRTDLLCPEGTPFPECLFGGNDGFRKSLIEFDWEANVYHSIVIRFIVGLLCDYMCRRIFAFLLNSPALNRQVAFWDKMKRFFIDILPRPLSDLLFQNPSPLQTTDVSTQTEPQGIDAYAQTDSFAQGIDASAQAEPIVQTAGTSTQTEVPELTSRRLSPTSHRSFLWPQQAINILKPRVSISDEIRDRSRVFQLPEESYFLRDE